MLKREKETWHVRIEAQALSQSSQTSVSGITNPEMHYCVTSVIDSILSSDEATYTVPKRDLVAIKHYPRKRKVTVVFDDEKSKLDILK